uniref:Sugar transporter n=1 Tax=Solanum tuberosum TaxID=4113 RepID=M1C9S9_SOLTU
MSTGVFTKEVQETSSASRFVDDLEDIQPLKSLNEFFHSCCPKVVAEVQPETPIEMLDDESPGPERSEVQLFDECFQRDISKRYISATYIDHEKSRDEFNVHNILSRFSLNARVNSFVVSVNGTTKNHSVWDPGIRFNSLAPTGYTDTMYEDPLKLLGSTDKFCFISYVNSTTQVWDPGQNLRMNSYIVEIIENKMVDIEINGISLTTIEGDNVDSQKEGSQSSHDGLHSTTSTSTLVPTEDWKDLVSCWALPRRTINMVMSSKGQTEISDKSYMRPLQKSIGQRNTKLCFLLLTSTYYELLEPYMDTLFELTTEGSDEDENVIALLAIELWSKVPKLDGLQCCERNRSFRWINHLHLGLKTQMFSLEEDKLIVTLCIIFEQRRGQIATQLTETSQDRLVVAEVQPETPIEMLDDESLGPERSEVQLFDECFQRDISKRYISATYIDHEKSRDEFNVHNILSRFSLNARVNSFVVSVNGTTKNHSVWDPGIRFNSLAPTGYTDTMYEDPLKLLGSTDKFCFISYVNSTTQVWDPGQNLRMNSYIVEIIENKMVDIEINGISLTTIEGDNVDSQKEGSQSSHDGLHSTTSTSTLVPTEDWKDLVSCWALPRRTINMVMSSKGQTEISDKSYMRPLQKSIGQRNTKLCFLLLTSTYYELLEPYMDTLFELTTEGSDEDENVIALLAIELWSKVPKLDGLQCCERNRSFRWINHLHLGLKTQMFSLEEDELIVTLCIIFEQRRGQIATQLTETSQDRLVSFFLPAPTVPIHNFGLLVDGYVMLELRCTTSGIVGVVMRGKITYFFGERDELCFSESICHVGWLAIIFGRNVSWFDIGSVLMGYGIWVISFKVSTYITEIKPKHLRDSFTIINQLTICYRRSLIIQLFGLFLIQDSPRWLTKATHWKACTTSLPHFKRNTVSISSTTTSVEEFISILQILSKVKMLDFLKRKDACSLVFGVGLVVLHQIGQAKAASYCAIIIVLAPEKYISFLPILEGYVNNNTRTSVVSAYKNTDFFLISIWTCQPVAFVLVEVSVATSSLTLSFVVGFLYSNLADKVLIEDGSIVMNQPQPNRDTNKDITQIDIGPSKSNRARPSQRIIWDPGPFTLC